MENKDMFGYYLTVNLNNMCRICLEKCGNDQKMVPIFDPNKPEYYSNLIMACAAVQVAENDGLPRYMCSGCVASLDIAFDFKTRAENSDARLRSLYTFTESSSTEEIVGTPVVAAVETSPVAPPTPEDDVPFTLEPEIKPEFDFDSPVKPDTPKIKKKKKEKCPNEQAGADSSSLRRGGSSKPHQCDACGKIFRAKQGLVQHVRIHTGERPYLCHLCDKRFVNGGHLHTHMRTHTGEKRHACNGCEKAFATAQQLSKHVVAVHTRERPYACGYCPKRCASSSNLATHVRIHTGEKNYRCDRCPKAFSTKGQLLQHILVHTGQKPFPCTYCDKRFTQRAHVTRHLKIHGR